MFDQAKAVENVLRQNAKVDDLINALQNMKSARINSAIGNDLWYLQEEYEAAKIAVSVFGQDDLDVFMSDCADDLMREHRFDIEEGRQMTRKELDL